METASLKAKVTAIDLLKVMKKTIFGQKSNKVMHHIE